MGKSGWGRMIKRPQSAKEGGAMKHFSTEEWADFARNVVGTNEREMMQRHLETGCKQCEGTLGLWQKVHEAAKREAGYEPPDAALRTVKAMYAIHGKQALRAEKATFAQLLFDSLQAPLQAGVRSAAADIRQLLYGSGDYRVDLRLEPQVDSEEISVVGQLLNSVDPAAAVDGVPLALLRAGKVVAESTTNRFGEFHFDTALGQNLQLRVTIPQGPDFLIPLVDPLSGESSEGFENTDFGSVKKLLRDRNKSTRKKV
jgi:hypothetical protein